jgi:hypothetical protein
MEGRESVAGALARGHAHLPRPAAAAPATFASLPHCPPALSPHLARRDPWRPRSARCTCRGGTSRCLVTCGTPGPRRLSEAPARPVSRLGCLDTPTRYTLLRGGPRQPPPASSPASSLLHGLHRSVVCGVADTPSHLPVPCTYQRALAHPPLSWQWTIGVSPPLPMLAGNAGARFDRFHPRSWVRQYAGLAVVSRPAHARVRAPCATAWRLRVQ